MPGPRPKPTAIREAEGNPGKRKKNRREPKPTGKASSPKGLTAGAAAAWKILAPRFERLGLLTDIDGPAFELLCESYAAWRSLVTEAEADGPIVEVHGQRVPNPLLKRADAEAARVMKLLAEFGATPAARTKVEADRPACGVLGGGDTDDLDQFLKLAK